MQDPYFLGICAMIIHSQIAGPAKIASSREMNVGIAVSHLDTVHVIRSRVASLRTFSDFVSSCPCRSFQTRGSCTGTCSEHSIHNAVS